MPAPFSDAPYAERARRAALGEVAFQRCAECAAAVFPPRAVCPGCGAGALGWEVSAGRGTVYATTAMHRRGSEPQNVALVDLDEGVRMMTRVDGVPAQEVAIGLRVQMAIAEVGGEHWPVARVLDGEGPAW